MDAPEDPPGHTATSQNGDAETTDNPSEHPAPAAPTDDADKTSRQSTPLSELSSPPETAPDDEATHTKEGSDGGASVADGKNGADASSSGGASQKGSSDPVAAASTNDGGGPSPLRQNPPSAQTLSADAAAAASIRANANTNAAPSGLIVPKTEPSPGPAGKTPTLDPKVVAVLELNALLLR